jgi:hypothetical protein
MKVSGFTFVKNAVKYGYPIVESVKSVLPLVDEMIVCLGDSEDETSQLIRSIGSEKIKIIDSVWDKNLREDGKVLAVETNKALNATAADSDWLFYIQADEVLHEQYQPVILEAMKKWLPDKKVEGLLFNYNHFYGSYKYIADGRKWYSREIRIIRNNKNIQSFKDAQGFRWNDERKLKVKLIDAYIYHYGWVRNPVKMEKKFIDFGKFWHQDESQAQWVSAYKKNVKGEAFDYSGIDSVSLFPGTHPAEMKELLAKEDWNPGLDEKKKRFKNIQQRLYFFLWKIFGWRPFEYRNYKRI